MAAIISLLVILSLSITATRIATVALTLTGLSRESARFQARSAFTGVGFTTHESEKVVNHPVRRRILMLLMLGGNAGFLTAASSLVLTFIAIEGSSGSGYKVVLLVAGLLALLVFANSSWIDRQLSRLIGWALKRYTHLDVRDWSGLLHLAGEYRVTELYVEEKDWLAGRELANLALRKEGVLVLGIEREKGAYIGAPKGCTKIKPGDTLVVYGRLQALEEIDNRRQGWQGDRDHQVAVAAQKKVIEEERAEDPAEQEERAAAPRAGGLVAGV